MSRAFVKEDDVPVEAVIPRPERGHPNYVTPAGLAAWQRRADELDARLAAATDAAEGDIARLAELDALRRDREALEALIETAIVVPPPTPPTDEVHFGARVTVVEPHGRTRRVHIVGADEVCIERGEVSWASPLGRALLGRRPGDTTLWERPDGNLELEILAVSYTD
jgi:transcription elongation GreA/GreB family factor